jgi:single-strand binding protein|nr:MAG TPA: Single strand binding protein [Caudoviricetes sp.]
MINNVTLTGRLTKAINLKYTQSGKAIGSFTLAVNRNYKDANGNKQVDFIRCLAWGKVGELLDQYCGKGSLIGIVGQIQTRNYENDQNQKVYLTEVNVREITFLETRKESQETSEQGNTTNPQEILDDDLPF